ENGLHFSLKSFFVKNSVGYPIRKPQKRYFAGLSQAVHLFYQPGAGVHFFSLLFLTDVSIITVSTF
ncbi:hypothetical protein, partial [Brevibacillus borstelensis]|uniref:hypothetical protein n=1 Tax=Brevibacillus borstelensis TaxID=45462 RepID=UPI002E1B70CF|nr:hypothetical protein [Brevibacillus borstelensis]